MQLIETIRQLLTQKNNVIIAIDGRCGSGKTTLADSLSKQFDCNVVHMDDFFLRPHQRTPERLATPGENVDHERFLQEVLLPLKEEKAVCYRPFDCSKMELGDVICLEQKKLTVVEGSYSLHPNLWQYYELRIFSDIDAKTQMERIVKRNPLSAEMFRNKWIPLEEAYFEAFGIKEKCDIIIKTQ